MRMNSIGQGRNRGLLLVTTRQFAPKYWRKLRIKCSQAIQPLDKQQEKTGFQEVLTNTKRIWCVIAVTPFSALQINIVTSQRSVIESTNCTRRHQ